MLAILALLALGLVALIWSSGWLASFGGDPRGERLARLERSPQRSGGTFRNTVPTTTLAPGTSWETVRRQLFGRERREPAGPIPIASRTRADFERPPASGLRATWLGHSTVLLEIEGARVLLDPMFSERASPSTLVGPKRKHAPPLPLAEVPPIDAVIISHDHYDHLDMGSVRALAPRVTKFAVPLGIGAHLERWGIEPSRIVELDWHQSVSVAGLTLTATPGRHFSGRGPFNTFSTLWATWVIAGRSRRVFFSGDTGYFDGFKRIGERHGPFDLSVVKIGAYGETWPDIHVNPEQAVQVHLDVGGRVLLPVHWATFNLAFHAWEEPIERAVKEAAARGVRIALPRPGESLEVDAALSADRWWPPASR